MRTSASAAPLARHRATALGVASLVLLSLPACGALRQNLRNEFLSYRGAYFCGDKDCPEKAMKRGTKGHAEGTLQFTHGKMKPNVALVFNPGKPVTSLQASVADCKGTSKAVPSERVKAPGSHDISGEGESWVVVVEKADLEGMALSCKKITVTATATWEKGTTYQEKGGVQLE